ncbi:unnamed protein product [Lactuca saligna]|uniref:Uncharacterized protein n=1 Tax=Lactuca saligna TaxID=75948 RepID=A0AA35Z4W2_LACSI|nr:unnamed protein product [Lactuca saligna]
MVPPTPSPINVVFPHQGDQGEANSKFKTVVLSQFSLFVQLNQSINKRLTKVEMNVATMKKLMALDGEEDDDNMVVDDTPPNSPGDNTPPPPPLSHPPPKPPSLTPISPPQFDASKRGELSRGSSTNANAGDTSSLPHKKIKLTFDLRELSETWSLHIDEVKQIMEECNVDIRQKKEVRKQEHLSAKLVQELVSADKYVEVQRTDDQSQSTGSSISTVKIRGAFQHTDDLPSAPTEHLFHLRLEGLGHYELERGCHVLISLELHRRLDELKLVQFKSVKPEILNFFDKLYNGSSDESEDEED